MWREVLDLVPFSEEFRNPHLYTGVLTASEVLLPFESLSGRVGKHICVYTSIHTVTYTYVYKHIFKIIYVYVRSHEFTPIVPVLMISQNLF